MAEKTTNPPLMSPAKPADPAPRPTRRTTNLVDDRSEEERRAGVPKGTPLVDGKPTMSAGSITPAPTRVNAGPNTPQSGSDDKSKK